MPIVFKDIGKTCSDLLSKDFDTVHKVEVKSKTSNGVEFTPEAVLNGSNMNGQLVAKYAFAGGMTSKTTVSTKGVLKTNLEAVDALAKGLTLTLEGASDSSGKTSAEYKHESFNCKAEYDYFKRKAAASMAAGKGSVTLGGSVNYNINKAAMTNYAAALQFDQPSFALMAKLADAGEAGRDYTGSYFHKVSSAMQVGAELSKSDGKDDINLSFGCAYKLDKDTSVKGKVNTEGLLSASYKQKVSSLTSLTLAAAVDTNNLADSANHKFGLTLNLTP